MTSRFVRSVRAVFAKVASAAQALASKVHRPARKTSRRPARVVKASHAPKVTPRPRVIKAEDPRAQRIARMATPAAARRSRVIKAEDPKR